MSFSAFRGPLVLAALCALGVYATFHFLGRPSGIVPYLLIGFFTLLSIGGRVLHDMARDPKQAVRSSMSAMALKMFASLIVLVIVIFTTPREQVLVMALTFGALYVVYLVFDTAQQFKTLRRS